MDNASCPQEGKGRLDGDARAGHRTCMHPELHALAARQGGVFTAAQAAGAGYPRHEVRSLLSSGQWVRLRRGTYAEAAIVAAATDRPAAHRLRAAAFVLALGPGAVVSHESAILLQELSHLTVPPDRVVLTAPQRTASVTRSLQVRQASLPESHIRRDGVVPMTTAARTTVDVAREMSFREAVVVADSALRRRATREEMRDVLSFCRFWPGVTSAARVVDFADGRAEAVSESLARVVFAEQGLPPPEPQQWVGDGEPIGRVDFLWRDRRTIGEVDGRIKYQQDPDALWREKLREERLREAGFEVVRMTWQQLVRHPQRTAGRVAQAFVRAGHPL